ncbi:MAG: hypothetical protein E7288_02075 [Lachnospiraceae bacterium]|nr:hypothetical protein [Lachnospiraceae bacterium]
MAKQNGAQIVNEVAGRRIIVSAGVGKTNADELRWLTDTVLEAASGWKYRGWAYVADCSQMSPVTPAEGAILVEMTKKFVDAGCKAFGFAEGKSIMLKVQAKRNTEQSHTGIPEGHYETVDEALAWIEKEVGI